MIKIFLLITFICDLFSPILIWKGVLPAEARYLSHVTLLGALALGVVHMVNRKRIPKALIPIGVIIIFVIIIPILEGHEMFALAWGGWRIFKYPLIAIVVACELDWTNAYARLIIKLGPILVLFEVIVQTVQLILGETNADQLAGSFSKYRWGGTTSLFFILILFLAFELGWWLVSNHKTPMIATLILGSISSVLGAMKIYFVAAIVMVFIAILIRIVQKRHFFSGLTTAILLVLILYSFPFAYDEFYSGRSDKYFDVFTVDGFERYFNKIAVLDIDAGLTPGRNFMIAYTWEQISREPLTQIMGTGLGTYQESKTLDAAGAGVISGDIGFSAIAQFSSLTIFLGEMGIMGIVVLLVLYMKANIYLWKESQASSDLYTQSLVYGLLLFSLFWPVWLWYSTAWITPASMVLYWTTFGFVLQKRALVNSQTEKIYAQKI